MNQEAKFVVVGHVGGSVETHPFKGADGVQRFAKRFSVAVNSVGSDKAIWYSLVDFNHVLDNVTLNKGDLIHALAYVRPRTLNIDGKKYITYSFVLAKIEKIDSSSKW